MKALLFFPLQHFLDYYYKLREPFELDSIAMRTKAETLVFLV